MKRVFRVDGRVAFYVYAEDDDDAVRLSAEIPKITIAETCATSDWDPWPVVSEDGHVPGPFARSLTDRSLVYGDESKRPLCELVQEDVDRAKSALVRADEDARQRKLFEEL